MQWFHVAEKKLKPVALASSKNVENASGLGGVQYPMKLKVTYRKARKYQSGEPSFSASILIKTTVSHFCSTRYHTSKDCRKKAAIIETWCYSTLSRRFGKIDFNFEGVEKKIYDLK